MTARNTRNINNEPGLLAHEAFYVIRATAEAKAKSDAANAEYGRSVQESGGDWAFDDDGAKATAEQAHQVEKSYSQLLELVKIVRASGVIEYPASDEPTVQIGSRVTIRINGKFDDVVDVTSRHIPGMMPMPPEEDIVLLSPESPLGSVILDTQVDQRIDWQVDGRNFFGVILGIDQEAQRQSYPQPTEPPQVQIP